MKLSSRADYAAKAMLELTMSPDRPVTLAYLAHTQNISISYLEQIFALLRKHGLVRSVRGPGGGYVLNKSIDEISVGDIVKAIDLPSSEKRDNVPHGHGAPESAHLWSQLSDMVYDYLSSVSLRDIHEADKQASSDSSIQAA
ncbi:MAG: Rrf2 family transcriptional regulator [Thiohalophilus sp.]|jgi:Rrf2 family iron-sulfur cluster assembly transcriptional regulator